MDMHGLMVLEEKPRLPAWADGDAAASWLAPNSLREGHQAFESVLSPVEDQDWKIECRLPLVKGISVCR
jgi:hypothetical protein